jgi:shikimate kinase
VAVVVLVGLPGSGKSAVGRAVARRHDLSFVDVDRMYGKGVTAATLLREIGEAQFRLREIDALVKALATAGIVSTGGGAVTTADGREMLKTQRCVWLRADPATLARRVGNGDRPLLGDDPASRLEELATERNPLYADVAARTIDASQSRRRVIEALDMIVQEWSACA